MDNIILSRRWVQGTPVTIDNLTGTAFTGEAQAHTFRISGVDAAGADVQITGTVTGAFLAPNNTTIPLTGTLTDGVAEVTLTSQCYELPGRFILSVYAANGDTNLCIYCGVGYVFCTETDQVAYPSAAIPDISQLIQEAQDVIDSIPEDYSELSADVSDLKSIFSKVAVIHTNSFDPETVRTGKYTTPSGSTSDNDAWGYVELFVTAGDKISFNGGGRYMTSFASVVPVSTANHVDGGKDTTTAELVTIPDGVTIMRFSFLLENEESVCIVRGADKVYTVDSVNIAEPADTFDVYDRQYIDTHVVKTNIITVATTDNLREVLEGITDAAKNNRYIIALASGTYDISSYYTAEEKAVENFAGLFVPGWCTLYGIGGPENVILTWVENSNKGKLSTINLYLNSGIENVTVKAEHLRYAVHDDWVPSGYAYENVPSFIRKIENCVFENKYSVVSCYGSGVKSGCAWKFDNCTFKAMNNTASAFYIHNNNGFTQSANVEFDNCRFIVGSANTSHAIAIMSLNQNSNVINNAVFKGCSINYGDVELGEDNASAYGAGIKWKISGYANTFGNSDVTITNTDGQDYSANVNLI